MLFGIQLTLSYLVLVGTAKMRLNGITDHNPKRRMLVTSDKHGCMGGLPFFYNVVYYATPSHH